MPQERRALQLFMAAWAILFAVGAGTLLAGEKLPMHAALNAWHTAALDRFFALFTHLGDGLVPTALALLLLFWKGWRPGLMVGLSCGLSAIVVQALKHGPYSHLDRPSMFRSQMPSLAWVDGIDLHAHHSFPSGHATASFAMCLAMAVVAGRARWAVPLALLAALLGYSRIYLSQHFLQDVVVGSAIGALTGAGVHWLLYRSAWSKTPWLGSRPGRRTKA